MADLAGNCHILTHIISGISGVLHCELNSWTSWLHMIFFRTNLVSILGKNGQMAIVAMSTLKVVMRPKNIVLDGLWEIPTTIMLTYWKNHALASSYAAKGPQSRYNRDILTQNSIMHLKLKNILLAKIALNFDCSNKLFQYFCKFSAFSLKLFFFLDH